jgi:tRNA (adenine37-N6)-methyltransferase
MSTALPPQPKATERSAPGKAQRYTRRDYAYGEDGRAGWVTAALRGPTSSWSFIGAMQTVTMTPIGTVRSTRNLTEDDDWDSVLSSIELDPAQFTADALAGLDTFSHIEVVYVFDRVDPAKVERGARHPRNNTAWPKVGIFAQRGKNRPNRIGTTICRVDRIEGLRVHVLGLDAVEGVREFGPRGEVRQPAWMSELMSGYWVVE